MFSPCIGPRGPCLRPHFLQHAPSNLASHRLGHLKHRLHHVGWPTSVRSVTGQGPHSPSLDGEAAWLKRMALTAALIDGRDSKMRKLAAGAGLTKEWGSIISASQPLAAARDEENCACCLRLLLALLDHTMQLPHHTPCSMPVPLCSLCYKQLRNGLLRHGRPESHLTGR